VARRSFTQEFKVSAARLVRDQGYSIAQAARSLGVDTRSIRDWMAKFAPPADGPGGVVGEDAASLRKEVERLRVEDKRLLMEREILKKATAFFAKELP
jgi:transposase